MITKLCTQCGAPLHGHICEYCVTEYEHEQPSRPQTVLQVNGEFRDLYSTYQSMGGNGAVTHLIKELNNQNNESAQAIQSMLIRGIVSMNDCRRNYIL